MKLIFLVALVYGLLGLHFLQAQSGLQFEHLSVQDGLSNNSVLCIGQDRQGFMWFGTADGLNKYDGYTFKQYRADPKAPKRSLQENYIREIFEDKKGNLWIGTTGLHLLDRRTDTFTSYLVDSTKFTYLNIALSIQEDQKGMLWFSAGGGLNRFDPEKKTFTSYLSPELTPNSGLAEDKNGIFWMGSGAGLYRFNAQTGELISFPVKDPANPYPMIMALLIDSEGILWIGTGDAGIFRKDTRSSSAEAVPYNPGGRVNKYVSGNGIIEDRNGNIWLATSEGLQKIDKKTDQVSTYQANPSIPGSLNSNNILSVFEDHKGTLWVGTDNGISRVITYKKPFHTFQISMTRSAARLDENKINTIVEDSDGSVWLGTVKGMYKYNSSANQATYIPLSPTAFKNSTITKEPKSLYIHVIREDFKGKLWVGTSSGLYVINQQTNAFTHIPCKIPVQLMAFDQAGKLWIPGGNSNSGNAVMAVFNPETLDFTYTEYSLNDSTGLKDMYMFSSLISRTGDVWVAGGMSGIGRMNQQTGEFTYYLPNPEQPESLIENDIRTLFEDSKGMIWAGTAMGGLFKLDIETGNFTNFTTHDGLPSNRVTSITEDDKGKIWLGTSNGLSCYDPKDDTFRNFDTADGLPDNTFRSGSVFKRNEKLYFGSDNGFIVFNPDSLQDQLSIPPVYITGVQVLEKMREFPVDKLELKYNENFISFDFTALDYQSPEKLQYAYKLENANEDWIFSGNRRYAAYTNLDPGEYIFRVKASNGDGIWNETGASLGFRIHPPFWRTIWAYAAYGFIGLALLYGFRRYTVNRERMKNDLKLKQIETQQLHELETIRSRFFANISHEFRTPLTLILGPLEKLLANANENQNRTLYQTMERNARRLLHLINQLLDLSKVESGSLKLETKPGNIRAFLKTLAASFDSLAQSRNIHFHTHISQEEYLVSFDRDKLEKIVVNLLSNAFKFTPDGGSVELRVCLKNDSHSATHVKILEIVIADSGIGIAPAEIDKIFDRFYQVDSSHTRANEGTGIGLALTKELVELHTGTITVASELGKGTSFTVSLPLPVEHGGASSLASSEPSEVNSYHLLTSTLQPAGQIDAEIVLDIKENEAQEKPLILIVEDNKDLSAYISSHFQLNFRVIEASNGRQGLQQAIEHIPDLIISDVMMPEMDGTELCKRLKTDERTSHIPVILLTAKVGEKSKLEGLETGADDYLTKPFSGTELQVRVNNLIELRKRLRERFSREVTLQPADIAITSADEKFLERVMAIVEANYMEPDFAPEDFEKEAGLSRTQFYRKLKALTDQAPGEFLRNFRLQKAVMLLTGGHGNISDVAYSVGFNSLAYFTRCFKDLYGKSPSQYVATHTPSDRLSDS
jgi:signal transduction histidine kinase/ligand-binding sensor domain-containing protein/CheY-like chemotaxis protein/AraC-like DNA-binding protein